MVTILYFEPDAVQTDRTAKSLTSGEIQFLCPTSVSELDQLLATSPPIELAFLDPKLKEFDCDKVVADLKMIHDGVRIIYYNFRQDSDHILRVMMAAIKSFFPSLDNSRKLFDQLHEVLGIQGSLDFHEGEEGKKKGIILLVDNEINFLTLIKNFLEVCGYELEVMEDTHNLLHRLKQKYFDLVLMDINLPCKCAVEIQKQIRKEAKYVFTVGMTWDLEHARMDRFVKSGAYTVMRKPFQLHNLSRILSRLIKASEEGARNFEAADVVQSKSSFATTLKYVAFGAVAAVTLLVSAEYFFRPPPKPIMEKRKIQQGGGAIQGLLGNSDKLDQIQEKIQEL